MPLEGQKCKAGGAGGDVYELAGDVVPTEFFSAILQLKLLFVVSKEHVGFF